jgi:hypothetical protein
VRLLRLVHEVARVEHGVVGLRIDTLIDQTVYVLNFDAPTFIITGSPLSARMRGANSEPRYASRFLLDHIRSIRGGGGRGEEMHRKFDANNAMAGMLP